MLEVCALGNGDDEQGEDAADADQKRAEQRAHQLLVLHHQGPQHPLCLLESLSLAHSHSLWVFSRWPVRPLPGGRSVGGAQTNARWLSSRCFRVSGRMSCVHCALAAGWWCRWRTPVDDCRLPVYALLCLSSSWSLSRAAARSAPAPRCCW